MLSPSQFQRPHHKHRSGGRTWGGTNLERAFFDPHEGDRRRYWANGVAEAALHHPRRGPSLIDAFVKGLNDHHERALNEEERATWKRLWGGCPHRSHDNAARAFAILAVRAPDLAQALLDTGLDVHRNAWTNLRHTEPQESTPWAMAVGATVRSMTGYAPNQPLAADGGCAEAWAFIGAHEAGASSGERQSALLHLAQLYCAAHIAPDAPAYRLREALFAHGATEWAGDASRPKPLDRVLGAITGACRNRERDVAAHQTWGLGFFRATAPTDPATCLNSIQSWPDPLGALRHLATLGVWPWASAFDIPEASTFARTEEPNEQRRRWREALVVFTGEHPLPETWLASQNQKWIQQGLSRLQAAYAHARGWKRHPPQPPPPMAPVVLEQEACDAWIELWKQGCRLNGWHDERARPMSPQPFAEGLYAYLTKTPECAEIVRQGLVATQTLGTFLLAASTDEAKALSFWHTLLTHETHRAWLEDAPETPQWPTLRKRMWHEIIAHEARSFLLAGRAAEPFSKTDLARWRTLGEGSPVDEKCSLLGLAAREGSSQMARLLATHETLERANAHPDFWEPWVERALSSIRSNDERRTLWLQDAFHAIRELGVEIDTKDRSFVRTLLTVAEKITPGFPSPRDQHKLLAFALEQGAKVREEDVSPPSNGPRDPAVQTLLEEAFFRQSLPRTTSPRARPRL